MRQRFTRRQLLFGVAGGTAVTWLAASSSAAQPATPNASPSPLASKRTVETTNGPVDVPTRPERVVCIDSYSMADMVDAGLIPVGITDVDLDGSMIVYKDALAEVPTIGSFGATDLERIVTLRPDVILSINADWATEIYDKLAAIAPTVFFDYSVPNAWQVLADQFTEAVGRSDELDAIKKRYADRVSSLKSTYADVLSSTKWAVAIGWGAADSQFTLYYPDSPPGKVLTDLGVQWVAAAANKTGGSEQLSYERLSDLADADVILTYGVRDGDAEDSTQAMLDQPLFDQLKAVQNDHLYIWQVIVPASYGDALRLLDQIEGVLKSQQEAGS